MKKYMTPETKFMEIFPAEDILVVSGELDKTLNTIDGLDKGDGNDIQSSQW